MIRSDNRYCVSIDSQTADCSNARVTSEPAANELRPLKVLQVINHLKRGGGAEALLLTFAERASAHNIECHIVSLRGEHSELSEEIEKLGVKVHWFPAVKLIHPGRFINFYRFLKSLNPDVIHTHLTWANILGPMAGRCLKIPAVVSLHNMTMVSLRHLYHGRLESWSFKHWISHVVAVGEGAAAAHRDVIGSTPLSVIPNAVTPPAVPDPARRQALRESLFPGFTGPLLCSVGRLAEQKGYTHLLTALAGLEDNFRCIIIGDGELRTALEQQAITAGLGNRVRFLGVRNDVDQLMGASDLYVSASLWEGLPVATLEAMSAGLPIVATDVGDVALVLGQGCGWLVEPADVETLREAISTLLTDTAQRQAYAQKALARVQNEYNADQWMIRLRGVYEQII